MTALPDRCDLLVVGSGAGGLAAAIFAARRGLEVLLVEREPWFGGTTAYSGGGMWFPGNPVTRAAGAEDDLDATRKYLDDVVGDDARPDLREAFLAAAADTVEELLEEPWMELEWKPFPDYYPEVTGSSQAGRAIFPKPISKGRTGEVANRVIPPLPTTRGGHDTGDTMIGGQALVARLLLALADHGVLAATSTELIELVEEGDAVVGAVLRTAAGTHRVHTRAGVLLAAGGFEHDVEARRRHGQPVEVGMTMGAPGGQGGAHVAAIAVGADTDLLDACWWTPAFATADGPAFRVRDRGHPGSIMVDQRGERFVNESLPYDRVGRVMADRARAGELHLPAWFIVDQTFLDRYGINGVAAGEPLPDEWFHGGWCHRAATLEELASSIGVDPAGLSATVRAHNHACRTGKDPFGRGETAFDRFFGDPTVGPNPCLAPIAAPPFHALPVVLSDLGTKGGLVCDPSARVLRADGHPIPGLYATGNTMAAWSGRVYPGPGVPIASSIVFGRAAVLDALGRLIAEAD